MLKATVTGSVGSTVLNNKLVRTGKHAEIGLQVTSVGIIE